MAGKSLNTGFEEELKRLKRECEQAEEWIVIGHTLLVGDPIIVDLGEAGQPVSYLMHGMGEWDAGSYIAGSMQHLRENQSMDDRSKQAASESETAGHVCRAGCLGRRNRGDGLC